MKFTELNLMLDTLRLKLVEQRDDEWKLQYTGLKMSVENEIKMKNLLLNEEIKKYNDERIRLNTDLIYLQTSACKIPLIKYFHQKKINKKLLQITNLDDSHDELTKSIKFSISALQTILESMDNMV